MVRMDKKTSVFTSIVKSYDEENLVIEHFISTENPDRGNDVVRANGMVVRGKPVVLKAHGWDPDTGTEPIAKALEIKVDKLEDGTPGIKAKTQFFNDETGQRLFKKAKEGYMPNFSIGFRPLDSSPRKGGGRDIKKWEILEYSQCGVPMNPDAAVGVKSIDFEIQKKEVIPFESYELADKGEEWDGDAEIESADVEDLKVMCAWYDGEEDDNKGAYKLPHHKADGYATVWNGVVAAMSALNGARGGVDIPDSDREAVYNHLVKHYKEFDEEPPELKSQDEDGENKEGQSVVSFGLRDEVEWNTSIDAMYNTLMAIIDNILYGSLFSADDVVGLIDEASEIFKEYGRLLYVVEHGDKDTSNIKAKHESIKKHIKSVVNKSASADPVAQDTDTTAESPAFKFTPEPEPKKKRIRIKKSKPKQKTTIKVNPRTISEQVKDVFKETMLEEVRKMKGQLK